MVKAYCEVTTRLSPRIQRNPAGNDLYDQDSRRGGNHQWLYLAVDPVCHNTNLTGMIYPLGSSGMVVMGIANQFLIGSEAGSIRGKSYPLLQIWSKAGEDVRPKRNLLLLTCCQLSSKYILSYHRSVLFSISIREASLLIGSSYCRDS